MITTPGERPPFDVKRQIADVIAKFASFKERVSWNLVRDLKPRVLVGMKSDSTPVNIHNANGYPQFVNLGAPLIRHGSTVPITNADAVLAVPAGETWLIEEINASMVCAAAVANRNLGVYIIQQTLPLLVIAGRSFESSTILLTTGQQGQIFFPISPSHWTNDNGTVARVADENPLPCVLGPLSSIVATADNKNAGDRLGIHVRYRLIS